ncbi:uncharacterized protein LOC111491034 [Cucurbita maxima]|uniref:Uncharacterized protein LOC111491034 n=1 Tax=Cucurbita maxima TaxID=3661 RepID=A0A6J1K637_CUCMA|nr:uncharacterized protein LOC111491034 [Cucurbita maxima]
MDPKLSRIPVKPVSSKPKFIRKPACEAPQITALQPPISRQKRVFGIVRSSNIPIKSVNENPLAKPLIGAVKKQPKSTRLTQIAVNATTDQKKITEKLNPKPKKKSPSTKQQFMGMAIKDLRVMNDVVEPQTPVARPRLHKMRNAGTPYHTAEKCSNCRFDKMETSSYWVAQIKLAESVGKHFVSADFFRLAYVCSAEPFRNLKVELKRYLTRHEHLSMNTEWKDVSLSYGLLQDENISGPHNPSTKICDSELDQDNQATAIESRTPEFSGSEFDKDEIVGTDVGELGTETCQRCPSSLPMEPKQTHQT